MRNIYVYKEHMYKKHLREEFVGLLVQIRDHHALGDVLVRVLILPNRVQKDVVVPHAERGDSFNIAVVE